MLVLVTTQPTRRAALVKSLNEHGVFVYITSYEQAEKTVRKKDTGGVLLDCVGKLPSGERLCALLREDYPQMPIAAIVTEAAVPSMEINRLLREVNEKALLADALDFCTQNCSYRAHQLSTYCLSVGNAPEETLYMGYRLPLSPKEHALLRFLFYRWPSYTSPNDLLELCYFDSNASKQNLTVQIARINRHAKELGLQPLIVNRRGIGYRLRSGIVEEPLPAVK
ncbi:MAG: winged helix-turn-helix domain-containing protein [Clostridia bacterium]|nr:winged helix-turn-helix domain-containing protein [Clostridia bacterium]